MARRLHRPQTFYYRPLQLRFARDIARREAQIRQRPDGSLHPRRESRHCLPLPQARAHSNRKGHEADSQKSHKPKKIGQFENTWSVPGFLSEGLLQPSEMGWGTHEKHFPKNGNRHKGGCGAAIYLDQPGARTLVRTWTPEHGDFLGRAVTHNESVSIADYYTVKRGVKAIYRPTVHYAYRCCDVAILSIEECFGRNSVLQSDWRILMDDIVSGMDELGVLLMGHKKNAYWYGSQLTRDETRKLAPYQNATGLQVTVGVLGGMIWAIENPREGIVEADEMDYERVMEVIEPYLGTMKGAYTDWTPLEGRTST